jgi:serine protease Do
LTRLSRFLSAPALAICFVSSAAIAQERSAATSEVFSRYASRVIKVQVVETSSGAKASFGSGFFVTADGHIVTNYHVISSLINTPERYRAEMIEPGGATLPVTVVAFDAVNDLAVLSSGLRGRPYFEVGPSPVAQGTRLFSLGHPKDLGLSIVEGTYNGLLLHTLYPRIHLTASLNPGMSGGPTIDDAGHVIGINVSTQGNQVSFLVPVDRATDLLRGALAANAGREAPSLAQLARQLRDHQDVFLRTMFDSSTKTMELGPFRVVTQPAPFFRCWGDATRDDDLAYRKSRHRCATDDDIYLDEDQTTGTITIDHELVSTKTLNSSRFFALYTSVFSSDNSPSGLEEFVTSWKCVTRNVRADSVPMRAVLCLRRYRKLGELYDGFLKVAVLGSRDVGLVSTLGMTGVTFDNVKRLSERYLRLVSWR